MQVHVTTLRNRKKLKVIAKIIKILFIHASNLTSLWSCLCLQNFLYLKISFKLITRNLHQHENCQGFLLFCLATNSFV